jgi:hypothetical protein
MSTAVTSTLPTQRAQFAAAGAALLAAVLLGVVLPRAAGQTIEQDAALEAGSRVEAAGMSVEVPEGWARTKGTELLVISKASAKLVMFPILKDPTTAAESVEQAEVGYTADKSVHATLGDVREFTTDSGLKAATVSVAMPEETVVLYAFSDGKHLASGQLSMAATGSGDLRDETADMMQTFELTGARS